MDTGSFVTPQRPPSPKLGDFSSIFSSGLLPRPATRLVVPSSTKTQPASSPIAIGSKTASQSISVKSTKRATAGTSGSSSYSSATEVISDSFDPSHTPASTPPTPVEPPLVLQNGFADWDTPVKLHSDLTTAITRNVQDPAAVLGDLSFSTYWINISKLFPQFTIEQARAEWSKFHPTPNQANSHSAASSSNFYNSFGVLANHSGKQCGKLHSSTAAKASRKESARFKDTIVPLYIATKESQLATLKSALGQHHQQDERLRKLYPVASAAVHVFVDLSNITIGFIECLKAKRNIPYHKHIQAPPFFFEAFQAVMERERRCDRRVLAGSVMNLDGARPEYMHAAEDCGYEMNILQRITKTGVAAIKVSRYTPKKNARRLLSDDSSEDSPATLQQLRRNAEQGVDELLHLKIMQSILDRSDPATMVIATGDAAEAEFSDGFKKHAERALQRGWFVELVAWKAGTSSSWRNSDFARQWGERFRIIELDSYVEELLGWSSKD